MDRKSLFCLSFLIVYLLGCVVFASKAEYKNVPKTFSSELVDELYDEEEREDKSFVCDCVELFKVSEGNSDGYIIKVSMRPTSREEFLNVKKAMKIEKLGTFCLSFDVVNGESGESGVYFLSPYPDCFEK